MPLGLGPVTSDGTVESVGSARLAASLHDVSHFPGYPDAGPRAWVVDPLGLEFDSSPDLDCNVPVSAPRLLGVFHSVPTSFAERLAGVAAASPAKL